MSREKSIRIPEADVAISSRVRLARNLEAYPFTARLTREQGMEILQKVKGAVLNHEEAELKSLTYMEMQALIPLDKQLLVEKHLISPDLAEGEGSRAAIISRDEKISIMVNEEDQLRLQCILPGMQLDEAWKHCSRIDS